MFKRRSASKQSEPVQRRAGYRVATTRPARVRRASGEQLTCSTADVSVTGVRLASCPELRTGEKVTVYLDLGEEAVASRAVVVRIAPQGGPALQFVGLGEREDRILGRFVSEAQRRSLLVAA